MGTSKPSGTVMYSGSKFGAGGVLYGCPTSQPLDACDATLDCSNGKGISLPVSCSVRGRSEMSTSEAGSDAASTLAAASGPHSVGKSARMPAMRASTTGRSPAWVMIQKRRRGSRRGPASATCAGSQTGRAGERVADRQPNRLGHLGAVLDAERGRTAALRLHHLRVDRARAQHAHADRQPVDRELLRQRLRDRHHRDLGRRVRAR